jgi:hypothetical protein
MKHKYSLIFILSLLFLSSCRHEDAPFPDDNSPVSNRTVLVYLGTDNNFRAEASTNIALFTANWDKNTDGNLLVYADAGENPVLVHICYDIQQQTNIADTIAVYPPENSANPTILTRVLNTIQDGWPALSYGLVVLSHVTGWLPANMSKLEPSLRSVIWDAYTPESRNYMELADFANAIPYKLDFIIFDACFMGSVEVCYELKDKVEYIVASPTEILSPGFVYSSMMQHLFKPKADLETVAREFYEYYDRQSGFLRSATISIIKVSALEGLAEIAREILHQSPAPDNLKDIQTFGYGNYKIYFDLKDYFQKLSPENYNRIQIMLDQCVVYKFFTDYYYSAGTEMKQPVHIFGGLSIYIPQEVYPVANEEYKKLKWAVQITTSKQTKVSK